MVSRGWSWHGTKGWSVLIRRGMILVTGKIGSAEGSSFALESSK